MTTTMSSTKFGGSAMNTTAGMAQTIHVRLEHACPILRAGLAAILSAHPEFNVSSGSPCTQYPMDECVVITDYVSAMKERAWLAPHSAGLRRVLVLTTHDTEWDVRHAVDSGVHGYLLQGCAVEELVKGVRLLGVGNFYLGATSARTLAASMRRAALTPRETDVLRVLARGCADKLIARELGIGVGTVKYHMRHLLEKLNATARTQAVVLAIQLGLLPAQSDELQGSDKTALHDDPKGPKSIGRVQMRHSPGDIKLGSRLYRKVGDLVNAPLRIA